jgi:hypothetical protein
MYLKIPKTATFTVEHELKCFYLMGRSRVWSEPSLGCPCLSLDLPFPPLPSPRIPGARTPRVGAWVHAQPQAHPQLTNWLYAGWPAPPPPRCTRGVFMYCTPWPRTSPLSLPPNLPAPPLTPASPLPGHALPSLPPLHCSRCCA